MATTSWLRRERRDMSAFLRATVRCSAVRSVFLLHLVRWPRSVLSRRACRAGILRFAGLTRSRTRSGSPGSAASALGRGSSCLPGSAFHLHPNRACREVRIGSTTSSCPYPRLPPECNPYKGCLPGGRLHGNRARGFPLEGKSGSDWGRTCRLSTSARHLVLAETD